MTSLGATPPLPAAWLAEQLGIRLLAASPVAGGCIHSAWRLEVAADAAALRRWPALAGGLLFAKTNRASALPLLRAEAVGLAALALAAAGSGLQVPEPLHLGLVDGHVDGHVVGHIDAGADGCAVLLLPWLQFTAAGTAAAWAELGAALARLHRSSLERVCTAGDRPGWFGWPHANAIGTAPQPNGWDRRWGRFFSERRLAPQLERQARAGGPLPGAAALLERLPGWLDGHAAEPVLVHGDLWSGNAALSAGVAGVIFDPAIYRGDREVDLAMAQLFGGFPAAFFAGYEATWPLAPGFDFRSSIYNLYHLLNHANLFGGGYRARAEATIQALLAAPRA